MMEAPAWKTKPVWLWWSSGKDSAWALRTMQADAAWDVQGLIGTVNLRNGRAAMHGIPHTLLQRQAAATGLPLQLVEFEWNAPTSDYRTALWRVLARAMNTDVRHIAFGDLFSTRSTKRRIELLGGTGLEAVFPLLGRDTRNHAEGMVSKGLSAWVCSVETGFLAAKFVGRHYDAEFLADLPPNVDPCGENDEFHTFVEWVPGWRARVRVTPSRSLERYGMAFAEMEPTAAIATPARGTSDDRLARSDPFDYYDRLRRVREHVNRNLERRLDLASVAPAVPMTPHAFGRFFREHVGVTFKEWLNAHRLDRAAALLRDHNHPLNHVSAIVGFSTDRTFRRRFHDRFGCTPSEYRQRVRRSRALGKSSDIA